MAAPSSSPTTGGVPGEAVDMMGDLHDTELLDLLQADRETTLLEHMDRDVASSTGTGAAAPRDRAASSPTPPAPPRTAFIVGGALFAPPGRSAFRRRMYAVQRTGLRLLDSRGRLATMSALHVGSLYCPFTHQFVSTNSPHWHHLSAVGFGLDASIRGGRRVSLVAAGRLYRVACHLQGCSPAPARPAGANLEAVASGRDSAETRQRAAAYYRAKNWSPLLVGTLGALLEAAPVGTYGMFCEAVEEGLRRGGGGSPSTRSIALCFTPTGDRAGDGAAAYLPWQSLSATPQVGGDGKHAGTADVFTTAGRDAFGAFGDAFLRETIAWRRYALQRCVEGCAATTFSCSSPPYGPPARFTLPDHVPAAPMPLLSSLGVRRPEPMLGLPPHTRAVALHLRVGGATTAEALLAGMEELTRTVVDDVARTAAAGTRIYVCPLAHSVDYSGVLDLVAFPVAVVGGGPDAVGEAPVPLLTLGLEGEQRDSLPPCDGGDASDTCRRVVVVTNAHLLSRHAVSRLLDQWTRNGAALRSLAAHRRRAARGASMPEEGEAGVSPAAAATVRWRLLLRAEPFTAATRLRYSEPFGPVQVVLVAQRPPTAGAPGPEGGSAVPPQQGDVAVPPRPVPASYVLQPRRQSLFHLCEPLSAALMRCGAVVREGRAERAEGGQASAALRAKFLRGVCTAAAAELPSTLLLKQLHSKVTQTGRKVFQEVQVPLQSPRGQQTLFQACEAVLTTAAAAGDAGPRQQRMEEVTASFPFLSAMHCRHDLVPQYDVVPSGGRGAVPDSLSAPTAEAAQALVPFAVVAAPAELATSESAMHDQMGRLARGALLSVIPRRRRAVGAVGAASIVTQSYSSLVEPPVLLGHWTNTLLFCAPAVADVLPLRQVLLEGLRAALAPAGSPSRTFSAEAVDIFHVDYVVFPLDRRCRLFGCRALLLSGAASPPPAENAREAVSEAFAALHTLLRRCAAEAAFFPLWTYHVLQRGGTAGASSSRPAPRPAAEGVKTEHEQFHFAAVDEAEVPCPPNLVERRLLALEAAQRPSLRLTVGCHVLLHTSLLLSCAVGHHGAAGAERIPVTKGTVCRVDGFVEADELLSADGTDAVLTDARLFSQPTFRSMVERYLSHQRGAVALPLLRPVAPSPAPATVLQDGFVLCPCPSIVGGHPSLHYYALPTLQLPVHLLVPHGVGDAWTPSPDFFANTRRTKLPGPSWPPAVPMCYLATQLLHPHHAAPESLSFLCLSRQQRGEVYMRLIAEGDGDAAVAEGRKRADCGQEEGAKPTDDAAEVPSASVEGFSDIPLIMEAPAEVKEEQTAFSCDELTALALCTSDGDNM